MNPPQEVTRQLHDGSEADAAAGASLMPLVYEELRCLARSYLARQRGDHTLQPTALVHEAWLRMAKTKDIKLLSRAHYFRIAAQAMRRILVDHARAHTAAKRGGLQRKLSLTDATELAIKGAVEVLALNNALQNLASHHPREGHVVELKFFGGLNTREISDALQISEKTVLRDWHFARLWLSRELMDNAA